VPEEVIPFRIETSQEELDDLRARLHRTRWPEKETVGDWSQGVPLGYLRELCRYWEHKYEWPPRQRRLNAFPQFRTEIDGLGIHFVHVRSPHPEALPLVMTHGWPGSVAEFAKVIWRLADPVAYGGSPDDAFHVVCPALPGYGFSDKPATPGWGVERIADAWTVLMERLGYPRFAAHGSDWGTSVSTCIGKQAPDKVVGLHLVPPLAPPDPATFDDLTSQERSALESLRGSAAADAGYSTEHATRPQTIGYALVDSPAALCAWIVEKFWAWTDHEGDLETVISRDELLDNLMLYWLTGSGASSARLYWESIRQVNQWISGEVTDTVSVPVGCSVFPKELQRPSRRWAARRFTDIRYWSEPARGGHFAALEQPALFVAEVRGCFRALRSAA
jgi:pimeloyl-ACP methyl ester carboxylesterase